MFATPGLLFSGPPLSSHAVWMFAFNTCCKAAAILMFATPDPLFSRPPLPTRAIGGFVPQTSCGWEVGVAVHWRRSEFALRECGLYPWHVAAGLVRRAIGPVKPLAAGGPAALVALSVRGVGAVVPPRSIAIVASGLSIGGTRLLLVETALRPLM